MPAPFTFLLLRNRLGLFPLIPVPCLLNLERNQLRLHVVSVYFLLPASLYPESFQTTATWRVLGLLQQLSPAILAAQSSTFQPLPAL